MAKEIKELFVTVNFHNASKDNFESDNYNYWLKTNKEIKEGSYIILNDNSTWDALKICKVVYVEERKQGKTYEKARTKALIGFADVQDYFGAKERKRTIKNLLKTMIEYKGTVFAHYVLEPYVTYTTDKEDKVVSTKQVEQKDLRSKG